MLTRNPHPNDGHLSIIAMTPLGDTASAVVAFEERLAARLADLHQSELTAVKHATAALSTLVHND